MVPDLLFKEIHRHKKADLPFVVYRFPNSSHFKTWLQFDDVLTTTTEFEAEGFVFAPYNRHAHAVLFKKEHCQIFETAIEPIREEHSGYRGQIDLSFKEAYQKMVQKAVDTIQHSDLQKVVLSRAFEIEMTSADNLDLFLRLASRYRNAFVYYWYHPKVGTWMGATPELLMQISRNRLTTVSLAGTLRADQKLNWTPKEKDEQKLVTEYIVSQLEPLANTITTGDTKEITAGKLKHLKTEISASLKLADQGLKEVILALHPTPAVCGYPKELAQKFIESNEGYDRSYYTGFPRRN
jgi:isochorismate synthase